MTAQIYLVAPPNADARTFPERLARVLDAAPVSALLLSRGDRTQEDYEALASAVIPLAQARDCAVLLDNLPDRVKALGADGVHLTGGIKAVKAAVAALRPDAIVGAADIHSRHDAMLKGEADVDYVMFGNIDGTPDPEASAFAQWWAETFEIPVVYAPSIEDLATFLPGNIDFVALGGAVWDAPQAPEVALKAIAERLGMVAA